MTIPNLEAVVKSYIGVQSIVKEQRENLKDLAEEIEQIMAVNELDNYVFELESGETVKVTRKEKMKKKLDKNGLAEEIGVDKSELTTLGMVKLAEDDVLTEKHVIDHTYKENKSQVKVKVRKPRKKKEDE